MPAVKTMTPALLRSVTTLIEQGATVLGWRPCTSPSLAGFPDCDREVTALADELWGVGSGGHGVGEKRLGKGRVCWGQTPDDLLRNSGVPPDFACSPNIDGALNHTHRRASDGADVYFLVNKSSEPIEGTVSVRVQGKQPEALWPKTGHRQRLAFFSFGEGVTEIPVSLAANESLYVPASGKNGVMFGCFVHGPSGCLLVAVKAK